jgi:hypothetical protein
MENARHATKGAHLPKATIVAILLFAMPGLVDAQSIAHPVAREEQGKSFIIASGGSFYSIAANRWYAEGGIGAGREFGRRLSLEIGLSYSPLETSAAHFGPGSPDSLLKTPIISAAITARAALPFAPALFFGAGAGVLQFDASKDQMGKFGASTLMGILGGAHRITNKVFGRLEGHYLVVRHPPFNGVNVEIVGTVGVHF